MENEHIRVPEIEAVHKSGLKFLVELSAAAIPGNPVTVAVSIRDITEQRAAEADRERFAAMVTSSPQSMIVTDLEGTVIGWNP